MTTDPTHTDKFGRPLKIGDRVELVYAGDPHTAIVCRLTRLLDVDHVTLALETQAIVPAGSVTRLTDKAGRATPPPTPDPSADAQDPRPEPQLPPDPENEKTTTTTRKPTTHRSPQPRKR